MICNKRYLCEMICHSPLLYSREAVNRAALWMLGYTDLSRKNRNMYASLIS